MPQQFGGDWTDEKLEHVRKYLVAYTTIMKDKPFCTAYIDAFAGSGYRETRHEHDGEGSLFPELRAQDTQRFLDGSARIALRAQPHFHKYIFIEKNEERYQELLKLKAEFPDLEADIDIRMADANKFLQDLCENYNWRKHRALLFLDPYGMQVEWETISAIARTKAIDMWILFPLGVAVNRLLRRDGQIDAAVRARLDRLFGSTDWFEVFYRESTQMSLFGEETRLEKKTDYRSIGEYFVSRLKSEFPGVAKNPLPLLNSKKVPLYLLCFAAANPSAARLAVDIAQQILGR